MRILIVEPRNTGHHIAYVEKAANGLTSIAQVTLYSQKESHESRDWIERIKPMADRVELVPIVSSFNYGKLNGWPTIFNEIIESVKTCRWDLIYFPTGDGIDLFSVSKAETWRRFRRWAGKAKIVVGRPLLPEVPIGIKNKIRRNSLRLTSWLLRLDACLTQHADIAKRLPKFHLVPEPTLPLNLHEITKDSAREKLRLTVKGPLCVIAGMLNNPGKGLMNFVEEFSKLDQNEPTEILIAGSLREDLKLRVQTIGKQCRRTEKIHFREYTSETGLADAISAGDLTVCPYKSHYLTSTIAAKSIACRRPIYAPKIGWFERTINELKCGYFFKDSINLECSDELAEIARQSLSYAPTEQSRLFAEYTSDENYQLVLKNLFTELLT